MYKTMFRCFGNGLELEGFCIILGARNLYTGHRENNVVLYMHEHFWGPAINTTL